MRWRMRWFAMQLGASWRVASVNLPDVPAPPVNAFYFKTWSENEGLLEQMEEQGAGQGQWAMHG
jgi:hypothetical protein